jgi:hypothetical protein
MLYTKRKLSNGKTIKMLSLYFGKYYLLLSTVGKFAEWGKR